MIDIKQLTQDKSHLAELWNFLGLPKPMPDISLEMMKYGTEMIESAFKTLKTQLNKGVVIENMKKYLGKILHNAMIASQTPEQRAEYISMIRATAGEIGARRKHANEIKAAKAELAAALAKSETEVLPEFASGLPAFAHDLPVIKGYRFKVEDLGGKAEDQSPAAPASSASLPPSSKSSNLEPKTKKPKTCPKCGEPRQRSKNHTCQSAGASPLAALTPAGSASRPPLHPSSGENVPPAAEVEPAAPPPTLCPGCAELMKNCTCEDDLRGDPCAYCGVRYLPKSMPLHLNGKCPTKKRLDREAAAKAAGL